MRIVRGMDDQIAKLLCDKCRPLLEAALRYERAELERKKARQDLRALTQGRVSGGGGSASDDDDVDMVTALATTKQKLSGSAAPPLGVNARGKPRVRAASRLDTAEVQRRLSTATAQQDLLRVIRGDFGLVALGKHLAVPVSSIYYKIEKLIGKHRTGDPYWTLNYGYRRNSKRAYDVLRKAAGKSWKEPSIRTAPSGEGFAAADDVGADDEPAAPPRTGKPAGKPAGKPGRPGPNDPPKPTISHGDLQALSNKQTTMYRLHKKYGVTAHYIKRQLTQFLIRYGADADFRADVRTHASDGDGDDDARGSTSADPSDRPDPAAIVAHVLRN